MAPGNVLLIVEVADRGWNDTLEAQARRYARANITQFLVLNLAEACIESIAWPGPPGLRPAYQCFPTISPSARNWNGSAQS